MIRGIYLFIFPSIHPARNAEGGKYYVYIFRFVIHQVSVVGLYFSNFPLLFIPLFEVTVDWVSFGPTDDKFVLKFVAFFFFLVLGCRVFVPSPWNHTPSSIKGKSWGRLVIVVVEDFFFGCNEAWANKCQLFLLFSLLFKGNFLCLKVEAWPGRSTYFELQCCPGSRQIS